MKSLVKVVLLLAVLLATPVALLITLRVGATPTIELRPDTKAIGTRGSVSVRISSPGRGLADVRVELVQSGRTTVVARAANEPLPPWRFSGPRKEALELTADVNRTVVPALTEGEAVVRVVAERAGTWLRHPEPAIAELRVPVRLRAPVVSVLSTQHYVAQGGSGVVVYRVSEAAVRDGVRAGAWFFPGAALPGATGGERFALFGVPWDVSDGSALRLVAEDDAGNASQVAFVDQFFPKPPSQDTIALQLPFLERVTSEIMAQTPGLADKGGALENYLQLNRELRKENADELVALAARSADRFLWTEAFAPMRNAAVMSSFADQRTYVYEGREVDRQTHLGFDLAATERTPVPAANRGIVLLARYFGIYGNTVVLDHGHGLTTIYSHLSSIDVKQGQEVARGATVGSTGKTGLAGGDHLHFTTLVRGLPVNATEWWDPHWIRDRIATRIAPFVAFEGEIAAPSR